MVISYDTYDMYITRMVKIRIWPWAYNIYTLYIYIYIYIYIHDVYYACGVCIRTYVWLRMYVYKSNTSTPLNDLT